MVNYVMLPPEVNTIFIQGGPGIAGLEAVSAGWTLIQEALMTTVAQMATAIQELAGGWLGGAAGVMAVAIGRFIIWIEEIVTAVARTITQIQLWIIAYEAAFGAMVPLVEITANRTAFRTASALAAVSPPAAAAAAILESQYVEMWVQCATAMTTYVATATASMASLPVFTPPPPVVEPAQIELVELLDEAAMLGVQAGERALQAGLQQVARDAAEPNLAVVPAANLAVAGADAAMLVVGPGEAAVVGPAEGIAAAGTASKSASTLASETFSKLGNYSDISSMVNNAISNGNQAISMLSSMSGMPSTFNSMTSSIPEAEAALGAAGGDAAKAMSLGSGHGGLGGAPLSAKLTRGGAASLGSGLSVPAGTKLLSGATAVSGVRALESEMAAGGRGPMMMPPPMMPPGAGMGGGPGANIQNAFKVPPREVLVMARNLSGG